MMISTYLRVKYLFALILLFTVLSSCKKDKDTAAPKELPDCNCSEPTNYTDLPAQWITFNSNQGIYNHITDIEEGNNGCTWIVSINEVGQVSSKIAGVNSSMEVTKMIDASESPYLQSKITSIGFSGNKLYMGAQFYSNPNLSKELMVRTSNGYNHFPASGGTAYDFEDFYFDGNNKLWYGTGNNGLINFDGVSFHEYDSWNSDIPYPNNVKKMFAINSTDFWIFTSNAMLVKTPAGIELVRENFEFDAMDRDADNNFWLINDFENTMTKLSDNVVTTVLLPVELTGNTDMTDLVVDTYGNIWISTGGYFGNGLFRYNGVEWSHYTSSNSELQSQKLTTLTMDNHGNLWVGSEDAGAICITKLATDL